MKFWLDKGACGYRMDVINLISKDQRFPDAEETNPGVKYHPGTKWYTNGPRMHEYLRELKQEVLQPYNTVTVGEMPKVDNIDEIIQTVSQKDGELNMIFIFDVVDIDNLAGEGRVSLRKWTVKDMVEPMNKWQSVMIERDGWNSVFIENHDNPRSVSRFCDDSDRWREKGAKLLALMQTTLSGTIFVYQGEEIGIRNMPKDWDVKEYKDIESINFWKKTLDTYGKDNKKELDNARMVLHKKARDHARTPMQWDDSPNAGFCPKGVEPWMRVMDDYTTFNTEAQMKASVEDDLSVWQYWQRGLANRKAHADVFVHGDYQTVDFAEKGNVFAYTRTGKESGKWLVVLNLGGQEVGWTLPSGLSIDGWMAGNYTQGKPSKANAGKIDLKPWEGLLGKCSTGS